MDDTNQKLIDAKMDVLREQIKVVDLKVELMRESFRFVRNTVVGSMLSPIIVGVVLYFLLR